MAGQRWAGVYTAITTKMDAQQEVDLAGVRADVAFQIENGVDGIICCGSIGEASTMTADEKMAIAAASKEAAGGRPVLLTVAEDSTRAAVKLAERAAAAGMDGLMLLPAMRYVSDRRETIQHFRTVARATGLPIMVYNNPIAYAVDITPEMFAEMADEKNFVAIKESSGDVRRITDIMNTVGDRYDIFTGVDDLALESLMLGAVGWVAGLVCAFPRETVAIHKLVAAGRIPEALEIYRWFMPLLHLDVSLRFVQNVKLAEAIVRGTATTVRQPRLELQGAERDRVETIVRTALAKRPDLGKYGL
ncbi:dihydrodipicolinate synthase family protein [Inquilinus limosus]|uniref:Dihydrodipicolinate synthase family protein n=1 Tax=Inquilinus limosus TaxID=171674 RepID=A0A211ZFW1_9PROT|nr:dihydrodipicolinate synthase family protein [Inquilinus limosus]OWJ64161.1 dihydrodipicolinate synthase family protein [Inquilinus limosus]